MLLNSLLRRLNGGTDTNSSKASSSRRQLSPVVYEKYPNLPSLIVRLLFPRRRGQDVDDPDHQGPSKLASMTAQKVFPALEIVERFGLPKHRRSDISDLINHHVEGPIWAVREKAAKVLAHVVTDKEIHTEIERLLENPGSTQNVIHGRLLRVRYMLARIAASIPTVIAGMISFQGSLGIEI